MSSDLLISVIIPVYNDAEGLNVTLMSLHQQHLHSSRFEVIVANDGGSPEIREVCQQYSVQCIDILPNQGSYHARNFAISHARAKNYAFVDADIRVLPDWLENGLKALKNADYVAGDVVIEQEKIKETTDLYEYYTAFDIKKYMSQHHFGVTANLFVKKVVFDTVGLFDDRLRSSGDLEFGDRVFTNGKFKQVYNQSISVLHPPRGYEKYKKKIKRGCNGQVKLKQLYPERFPNIVPSFFKAVIKMVLPPNPFKVRYLKLREKKAFRLFLFGWHVNFLKGYYTVKAILAS